MELMRGFINKCQSYYLPLHNLHVCRTLRGGLRGRPYLFPEEKEVMFKT